MRRQAATFLAVAIVTFLAWEAAARLFYVRLTPERGRRAVSIISGERSPDDLMGVQFHPYLVYANRPGEVRDGFRQHNANGYRGPENTPLPRPGVIRILALGGSTTYGHLLDNPADAWPARLATLLSSRLGKEVEVINGGLVGALSADMLVHYLFRDRFLGAHYVILHEGGNDAPALFARRYQPDYSNYRGWVAPSFGVRRGERTLMHSYLARVAYAWWLKRASLAVFDHYPAAITEVSPSEAVVNVTKNEPLGFARNMDLLVRNIVAEGAAPILFPYHLAPPAIRTQLHPEYAFWNDRYDAFALGLEKDVTVMRSLASRYRVPFFQLGKAEVPVSAFFDFCHLRREGEAIVAAFLADKLEPLIRAHAARFRTAACSQEHHAGGE